MEAENDPTFAEVIETEHSDSNSGHPRIVHYQFQVIVTISVKDFEPRDLVHAFDRHDEYARAITECARQFVSTDLPQRLAECGSRGCDSRLTIHATEDCDTADWHPHT